MKTMDKTKIANYVILREQGKSLQEIADIFNVSKQAVAQELSKFEEAFGPARKSNVDIEKIVYKGIYDLFVDNGKMTYSRLTRLMYGYYDTNTTNKTIKLLRGENVKISIKTINRLIEITGKSYETLFELREREKK